MHSLQKTNLDVINTVNVAEIVLSTGTPVLFSKGYIVVHQDEFMKQMYFIKKGIVRGYYLNDEGKEVTKCFSAEGEIFGVEGFLYHRKASYFIECLEEVECIELDYELVKEWMIQNPQNISIVNEMIVNALKIVEMRAKDLLLSDASDRYQAFLTQYGNIASRIKQKVIASYLGIDEASLSRIKKKIEEN